MMLDVSHMKISPLTNWVMLTETQLTIKISLYATFFTITTNYSSSSVNQRHFTIKLIY